MSADTSTDGNQSAKLLQHSLGVIKLNSCFRINLTAIGYLQGRKKNKSDIRVQFIRVGLCQNDDNVHVSHHLSSF